MAAARLMTVGSRQQHTALARGRCARAPAGHTAAGRRRRLLLPSQAWARMQRLACMACRHAAVVWDCLQAAWGRADATILLAAFTLSVADRLLIWIHTTAVICR